MMYLQLTPLMPHNVVMENIRTFFSLKLREAIYRDTDRAFQTTEYILIFLLYLYYLL